MVQFCCVSGCGNRSNRDKKAFYRLPIVPKHCASKVKAELCSRRRKQWLANIDRVDLKDGDSNYSKGYIRVCSDHFYGGKPSALIDVDHPDWAPTIKMGKGSLKVKGTKDKYKSYGLEAKQKRGRKHKMKDQKSGYLQITSRQMDDLEIQRLRELAQKTAALLEKRPYISVAESCKKPPRKQPPIVNRVAKKTFMQRKLTGEQEQLQINNNFLVQPKKVNLKPGTILRLINNKLEICNTEENFFNSKPAIIHKITSDSIIVNESAENCSSGEIGNLEVNETDLLNITSTFQSPEEKGASKDVPKIHDNDKVSEDRDTTCETSNGTANFRPFEEICDSNYFFETCDLSSTEEEKNKLSEERTAVENYIGSTDIHKVDGEDKICSTPNQIPLAELCDKNYNSRNFDKDFENDEICNVTERTTHPIKLEDINDSELKSINTKDNEIKITCEINNEQLIKVKTEPKELLDS